MYMDTSIESTLSNLFKLYIHCLNPNLCSKQGSCIGIIYEPTVLCFLSKFQSDAQQSYVNRTPKQERQEQGFLLFN